MPKIKNYKLSKGEQLKFLQDISSLFTLGPDIKNILHILLDRIGKRIDVTYLAVWLINEEGNFEIVSSYHMSKTYLKFTKSKEGMLRKNEGVVGQAYLTKRPVLVKNFKDGRFIPQKYVNFIKTMGIDLAGLICFPLIAKNQVIGTVNFYFPKPKRALLKSEINFISIIANQMANFIQSAKSFQELREEKNKTASIISNFVDPVIVMNEQGALALVNPPAKKIFKLSRQCLGKKVADDNGSFSFAKFKQLTAIDFRTKINKYDAANEPLIEEVTIAAPEQDEKNFNPFWAGAGASDEGLIYKVLTAKVRDRHGNYGVMKIFNDLTREKIIDKMKSEFISIAAHQLRTPLTSVKWVIKMMLNGDLGALNREQSELLAKAYNSNERIVILVNNMLNVSRIEEGKFGYSFVMSDFNQVLRVALEDVERKISLKKINFTVEKPEFLPQLPLDIPKMILALENLLENSIKYTPENGKITVKIEPNPTDITVRVIDNGVGIPDQEQTKLFSKFFRASNAVRLQTEGSGLGLFIVKKIIEEHGGKIACKSREGIGTEFAISLPLKR